MVSIIALKVFLTAMICFVIALICDSFQRFNKEPVSDWVAYLGGGSVLVGLASLVIYLLSVIWS